MNFPKTDKIFEALDAITDEEKRLARCAHISKATCNYYKELELIWKTLFYALTIMT